MGCSKGALCIQLLHNSACRDADTSSLVCHEDGVKPWQNTEFTFEVVDCLRLHALIMVCPVLHPVQTAAGSLWDLPLNTALSLLTLSQIADLASC